MHLFMIPCYCFAIMHMCINLVCNVCQVGTKSVKQCVEFYYVWKKVCEDDYRLLCKTRKQQSTRLNTSCSDTHIGEMKNQGVFSSL